MGQCGRSNIALATGVFITPTPYTKTATKQRPFVAAPLPQRVAVVDDHGDTLPGLCGFTTL